MTSLTIQIARWLKKEEVWRYVGFVSTIVGLLCYGLSSSLNSLFREWSLFKIFLYSVFSLFICLWSLFAKVWQYSTSLRFKAHSAFLVLTITSVYSYFADKAVNGKPDVYSLISGVAFAIMSLSLSRQTQCGFEVDLLYFFLACLIVLLMKIKLALAIVGVGFSYALIILRSSLDTISYENLGVQDDSVVIDVNSLGTDNASMMPQLLTCIRALQQGNSNVTNMLSKLVMEYLEDNSKPVAIDSNFLINALPSGKINELRKTINLVMGVGFAKECYEEYCNWRRESLKECLINLLGLPEINVEEKSRWLEFEDYILDLLKLENDDQFVEPNANAESMKVKLKLFNIHFKDLCSNQSTWFAFDMQLREQMIMSLENNLLQAYGNFIGRFQNILGKHAYEHIEYGMFDIQDQLNNLFLGSMSRLGLQKLSIEEVHKMTWQDLEDKIEKWIKASNVALKILFPSERRLCDRVFFGFASAADFSFMEVCHGLAIQLLNFADAIAIGSWSPERLFSILDVFETLRDLFPEFEALFSDQFSVSLRNEAITIRKRLGEAIRRIFMVLENLIRRDPAKIAVPGGGLHPITCYVMNYLRAACRSRQSLEQVFEDYGLKEYPKLDDRVPASSSLSVQMDWIMELLESNLEAKSKIYKDPALCYVFLMNNGRYIVQKTKDSELGTLLGDDWIRKHAAKVREFHVHYQRSSWNKVLGILKLESNGSMPPVSLAKSMKEKLKSFNTVFEEICREQSSWYVFDEQLREEIRISLEKILLPAYGNFVARFQSVPELGKHADKYIKYGTEEIQARLNGLFQGSSGSTGSRK